MDDKVYTNEVISDAPFPTTPNAQTVTNTSGNGTGGNPSVLPTIPQQAFPLQQPAVDLISVALNTKTKKILQGFSFTPSGSIQVGTFEPGVSGDIRIDPSGILARNLLGDTTFVLDGDTGDAIFAGEIRSGTTVTGRVVVGNNNVVIDGANQYILINDGTNDRILIGRQVGGF